MCGTRLPQKKSYDVVNWLALLLICDDFGRSKGRYWDGNSSPWSRLSSGDYLLIWMASQYHPLLRPRSIKGRVHSQHHMTSSEEDVCQTSKIQGWLKFPLVLKGCLICLLPARVNLHSKIKSTIIIHYKMLFIRADWKSNKSKSTVVMGPIF